MTFDHARDKEGFSNLWWDRGRCRMCQAQAEGDRVLENELGKAEELGQVHSVDGYSWPERIP